MKLVLECRMISPLFVKDYSNFTVRKCQFIWIDPILVSEENYLVLFPDPEYEDDDIGYLGRFHLIYESEIEEDVRDKADELILEVDRIGNFTDDGQGRIKWVKGYFTKGVEEYEHFLIDIKTTERVIEEFTIKEEITETDISDQIPAALEAWRNYVKKEKKQQKQRQKRDE